MSDISKTEIQDAYWKYLLLEGSHPNSVFAFMHSLNKEESAFYEYYPDLESIETGYWESTIHDTIEVLEKDEDYEAYSVDQKLLAFYFTYINQIQVSRSRFTHYFPKPKMGKEFPKSLKGMKDGFKKYASDLVNKGIEQELLADRKQFTEQYDRFLFMHFLAVIDFYLKDKSKDFQDTDAFIEKSTHFAVQAASRGFLDSGLDFLRFIAGKDNRLRGMSKMISKFIPQL